MSRPRILFADDEEDYRELLAMVIQRAGYEPMPFASGEALLQANGGEEAALIVLDMMMPGLSGIDTLKTCRERYPSTPVVMISGQNEIDLAVEAMKRGAADYIQKPFDLERVTTVLRAMVQMGRLAQENQHLRLAAGGARPLSEMVGVSLQAQKLQAQIEQLGQSQASVLITGESGVGKSFIARLIHYHSTRAAGPFISASCPSLPSELVESELFGHERGAFTGAVQQRKGRAELADGGSLFLDEIGDLPLALQPKLLTFLQDHIFQRVGGSKDINVDVRVITATHVDLREMVRLKQFREDLFYRLNVVPLHVPPLRERGEDIEPLVQQILSRLSRRAGGGAPFTVAPEALEKMLAYRWPGNVRELENALERATVFAQNSEIKVDDLPEEIGREHRSQAETVTPLDLTGHTLAELERMALEQTLQACAGNRMETSRRLGVSEKTVYNLLSRYQLNAR